MSPLLSDVPAVCVVIKQRLGAARAANTRVCSPLAFELAKGRDRGESAQVSGAPSCTAPSWSATRSEAGPGFDPREELTRPREDHVRARRAQLRHLCPMRPRCADGRNTRLFRGEHVRGGIADIDSLVGHHTPSDYQTPDRLRLDDPSWRSRLDRVECIVNAEVAQ